MLLDKLLRLRQEMQTELNNDIIPFWVKNVPDNGNNGFWGYITNDMQIDKNHPKGVINHSRLLWTFSTWYRNKPDPEFARLAKRAYDFLDNYFIDSEYKGVFWTVSKEGQALDSIKRIYAHAFYIYALSEYFLAFEDPVSLERAKELFFLIEEKSYDTVNGGYFEAFNRDWSLPDDMRLSDVDMNEKKSMNTHLHILEAYTNLYRIWKEPLLSERLQELIDIFFTRIVDNKTNGLHLFFDEKWNVKSDYGSFGHDIEASWLLYDAALVLNDKTLLSALEKPCLALVDTLMERGIDIDGGILYEYNSNLIVDKDKHWWPQAEAIVGFVNAWQLTRKEKYIDAALKTWNFIHDHIIDHQYGEWFWKVSQEGVPDLAQPKVCQWKTPYHNSRACLEIINRLKSIQGN